MTHSRQIALLTLLLASTVAVSTSATVASAAAPRASLTDVEDEVMCVVCHTPLAVSQSPQANAERGFIRSLILQGQTKTQIKRALVAQYGQGVLALPSAHGFNLSVYILPPLLLLGALVMLGIALPRWRRRTRAAATHVGRAGPALAPAEGRRLDEDLARFH